METNDGTTPMLTAGERLFSMKEMAQALDVSESTCKRWCDRGLLTLSRTAGGHRRVTRAAVFRFAAENHLVVVRPEIIALPVTALTRSMSAEYVATLVDHLLAGREYAVREIIVGEYVRGTPLVTLCDDLLAPAMHGVGDAWESGTADVYQERRSCDLVEESLQEIGRLIAAPPANGPLALGGTLEHDGSRLATRMVELVLRQAGWRAHSIGAKLPAASLAAAVRDLHPQLVWVSVSHPGDFTTICDQLRTIRVSLPVGASMFVGGAGVDARLPRSLRTIEFGASLRELLARVRC